MDFPAVPIAEFNSTEVSAVSISKSLNGASVVEIHKTTIGDLFVNFIPSCWISISFFLPNVALCAWLKCIVFVFSQVVLASGKEVVEVEPQIDEIVKLPGRGMIITGAGPSGTEFDFCSRFFCPQLGIDEVIHDSLTFERLEFCILDCSCS